MGDYDEAIVCLKKQLSPIKTLANLSHAYCRKGDYQQAMVARQSFIDLNQSHSTIPVPKSGSHCKLFEIKRNYAKEI